MKVLSMFDGVAMARESLEQAEVRVTEYVGYEIDESLHEAVYANFPEAKLFTDVNHMRPEHLQPGRFDLMVAGSPCQGFSFAGKMRAFDDPRSALFWRFHEALEIIQPEYFLLENVYMAKQHQDVITEALGVEPILLDAKDVGPIRRKRLYWTNIPQPAHYVSMDRDPFNYLTAGDNRPPCSAGWHSWALAYMGDGYSSGKCKVLKRGEPAYAMMRTSYDKWMGNYVHIRGEGADAVYGKLTPGELERMHGLPEGYTAALGKDRDRYRAIGNGWAVTHTRQILGGLAGLEPWVPGDAPPVMPKPPNSL